MTLLWPKKPLAQCAKFLSGGTPHKTRSDFWDGDIPWVSSGEMATDRIYDTSLRITQEGLDAGSRLVPEGTILAVVRGMSLAKDFRVAITMRQVAFNQDLKAIVPTKGTHPRFLYYALRAQRTAIRDMASEASHGTKKLPTDVLGRVQIPHPEYKIQERVAEVLWQYGDLIANNTRRIKLLEEAARLLYEEWFVRLRFPGHEHTPIHNGIPEGWSKQPLGSLASIVMGQSPKSTYYNENGDGLPFHQGVTDFGVRFPTNRVYCTVQNRLAEPGDILFSVRAPVGRINIAPERLVIGRGLSAIRSTYDAQNWLFYALKNHFFKEDLIGGGAIFAAITKTDLHRVSLLCPTDRLVKQFMDFVVPIDHQIALLHRAAIHLQRARDLLLPRLMSGEIAV